MSRLAQVWAQDRFLGSLRAPWRAAEELHRHRVTAGSISPCHIPSVNWGGTGMTAATQRERPPKINRDGGSQSSLELTPSHTFINYGSLGRKGLVRRLQG